MPAIIFRATLRFKSDLLFGDFLPRAADHESHIRFNRGDYHGLLYLADEDFDRFEQRAREHVAEAIGKKHVVTRILTLELHFCLANLDAVADILAGRKTERRRLLVEMVASAIRTEHAIIRDILRDYLKNGGDIDLLESESAEEYLAAINARFRYQDQWYGFGSKRYEHKTISMQKVTPINRLGWLTTFKTLYEAKIQAPIWHHLLVSAVKNLEYDPRLSLINTVTVLEPVFRIMVPEILERCDVEKGKQIAISRSQLVSKSIYGTVKRCMPMLVERIPSLQGMETGLLALITRRNKLVHRLQHPHESVVPFAEGAGAIKLVAALVETIEPIYRRCTNLQEPVPTPVSSLQPIQLVTFKWTEPPTLTE